MEQAGGVSTTGAVRVLDIQPNKPHERAPVYMGCERDITAILRCEPEGGRGHWQGEDRGVGFVVYCLTKPCQ